MSAKVIQYRRQMPEYFDQLPTEMQSVAREFLAQFAEYEPGIEDIECRRRDGFIPYSWNRGGLQLYEYRDLNYFWGGGYSVGIPKAQVRIDFYVNEALNDAKKAFIERYAEELSDLELTHDEINYHNLEDKGLHELANEFCKYEQEFTQGEYNGTRHSIRVLYSGEGEFNVEVFHSVSDAPYHRSCDGSKRWEFNAFNALQLKHELEKIKSEVVDSYL